PCGRPAASTHTLPLHDALPICRRLALVRPDRGAIAALGARYLETLVPDARETVAVLRAEGIDVRIISGGLLPAVRAVAEALGVRSEEHTSELQSRENLVCRLLL